MQLKQQIEPCMRITVQIPKDAAQRLRQLAAEGNPSLRALGIRSVQIEGDTLISLNLSGQHIDVKVSDISSGVGHGTYGPSIGSVSGSGGGCNTDISNLSQILNAGHLSGPSMNSAFVKLSQDQLQYQQQISSNLIQHHQQRGSMAPNTNFASNAGVGVGGIEGSFSLQHQQLLQQRRNMMLGGPSTSNAAASKQPHQNSCNTAISSQPHIQQQHQLQQQPVFKSPNTVCPMDGKVPVPPLNVATGNSSSSREFPFESMRQARVLQGRDNSLGTMGTAVPAPGGISLSAGKPALAGVQSASGLQQQLMSTLGPPPNVALRVIKNPQSGEVITTTVSTASGKTQFLQPPPPPYPGVGSHNSSASQNSPATAKPISNYLQSRVAATSTNTSASPTAVSGSGNNSNNIAMSSPLLVNLLQNDSSSVGNQVKTPNLPSPQQQQQHHQQQQLPLMHQQQPSPMMAAMSPQNQIMNSPLRTTTPGSEFIMQQHPNQVQQQVVAAPETPDNVLSVPSSPTANNAMRSMPGPQQIMLSPSNNLYSQQQQQQQRFQQQQVSPQQTALLRQRQQQLQAVSQLQNQQRFVPQQQQQMLQQAMSVNTMLANQHQQQQMRQIRVGSGNGVIGSISHQTPPSPLQHHQQRLIGMPSGQQQQYMPMNTGNLSPATANSPASSHHSMHSPHMASQHNTHQQQQQLLSPSTTPAQSPLTSSHLTQQLLPPPQSPSNGLTHNTPSSSHHIVPSSPSAMNMNLPPPPDYNQAASAASSRWPASLNKPMDSATKSSFQEFTRYQMQYNLQQQQTQQQQQQIISDIANSLPGASSNTASSSASAVVGSGHISQSGSSSLPGISSGLGQTVDSTLDSQTVNDLADPLITLSDLEALTTNDLEALLPTLSCDIDSSLSLDDKNELDSLLDLDLIEGMDIDETAAAASSLLEGDDQLPSNVTLAMDQIQTQTQQHSIHHQNLQLQLLQQHQPQRQLQIVHNQNSQQNQLQQQPQQILQQRLQQPQDNSVNQQSNVPQNQNQQLQQQFHITSNQQQFNMQKRQQQQQHITNSSNVSSKHVPFSDNNSNKQTSQHKQFLINPLTGELEPSPSDDSDTEAEQETQLNSALHNKSNNITTISQGSNCNSNNSTTSIYDMLPNSATHFSEDSNSNSCSTAISKLSGAEQNNGGSSTPQMLGAGSDTERSRDSLISIKSQKSKSKAKANTSMGNLNINTSIVSNKPGDMGSPRSNTSSPSVAAMLAGSSNLNKKSKTNLLRDKLQQGVREKKNKEAINAGVMKPKRERSKAGSKAKTASAAAASAQTNTKQNSSAMEYIFRSSALTNSTISNNSPSNTMINTTDSAATALVSSSLSSVTNVGATEKIKLRLKLEKSEPVSPAYKVDVTFGSDNFQQQQQQSEINAHLLASNTIQQQQQQLQQPMTSTQFQQQNNSGANTQQKSSLSQQASSSTLNHPPQYQHQQQDNLHPQTSSASSSLSAENSSTMLSSGSSSVIDEPPRVPPLHISLRGGKNSIVKKNSRKERKKTQSTLIQNQSNFSSRTENDSTESSKPKLHLKRSHSITDNTTSTEKAGYLATGQEQQATEAKQPKQHGTTSSNKACINGGLSTNSDNSKPISNTGLVPGKNGLTISATTMNNNATIESNNSKSHMLIDSQSMGSTNIGTLTHLPPQQLLQPSTQQQLAKISSLPNSITLSTIANPNTSTTSSGSVSGAGLGTNANSLQIKHNLKTTATITPIQGKPLTKNHKPPPYIAAVQQLQLQKQQQQQQLAALAEKQTQQQMIAAAVTMLPSATTLKRVEITKVERKDSMGNIEHVLIKSNEPVLSNANTTIQAAADTKANTPPHMLSNTTIATTTTTSTLSSSSSSPVTVPTSLITTMAKTSTSVESSSTKTNDIALGNLSNPPVTTFTTTLSTTTTTTTTTTISSGNANLSYNQTTLATTLRNSPASTGGGTPAHANSAGGEDSGIESMDALSEKSPHQLTSSSPQSLQPQPASDKTSSQMLTKGPPPEPTPKTKEEVTTQLTIADDEIEKALAKMEGFADEENIMEINCLEEKNVENKNGQQKLNGNNSLIFNDRLKQNNVNNNVYNNVHHHHHHHDDEDDDDDEDLIKNLTASIIEEHEADEKAAKEKLENEIREKEELHLREELEKEEEHAKTKEKSNQMKLKDIKTEDFEEKIVNTTTIIKKDDSIKIEISCNNNNDVSKQTNETKKVLMESSLNKVDDKRDFKSSLSLVDDKGSLSTNLTPISIEIPQHTDIDSSRIRTRASSRLGSPMDVAKSSPTLDTSSSQSILSANKHISTRSSSHTQERISSLSPKSQINSSATSSTPNEQKQQQQNHHKRKRNESESEDSSQGSGESEAKRARNTSTSGSSGPTTTNSIELPNKKSDDGLTKGSVATKKIDESSDSDEPLIEVAGKVRSSKAAAVSTIEQTNISHSTTSILSSSTNLECVSEKVTRNSRSHQQQQNKTSTGSETTSPTTTTLNACKSGKLHTNGGVNTSCSSTISTTTTASNNSASTVTSSNSISTTSLTTPPVHATRGATNNNTVGIASANHTTNASSGSPSDEKIGTRRSVRASAAANKVIYTRGGGNHSNSNMSSGDGAGKVVGKIGNTNTNSESVAEARRKTRSAVVGESMLTEGRRRRGSRDYK